jgi:glycine dehydrogenase
VLARAQAAEINLRSDILNAVGITLDETTTREDVQKLFAVVLGDAHGLDIDVLDKDVALDSRSVPAAMLRDDAILSHPVFNRYHSETEMMRYALSGAQRSGAQPGDDPAGILHHEAERRSGNDPDHLA